MHAHGPLRSIPTDRQATAMHWLLVDADYSGAADRSAKCQRRDTRSMEVHFRKGDVGIDVSVW
jgi:hypothetical protein